MTQTRQVELALSISIILANLSNNEEYIETLLGVNRQQQAVDFHDQRENEYKDRGGEGNKTPEERRIIGMLNLLSHEDPFISE